MADLKAKKPAADEARGLLGIVHLGRSNCSEANLHLLKIQGQSTIHAALALTARTRS
jgi:hypothetical protein